MNKKIQAQNHPKKGSSIKVEPIRSLRHARTVKKLLATNPRDYCLYVLGVNSALRAGELLSITAVQVKSDLPFLNCINLCC